MLIELFALSDVTDIELGNPLRSAVVQIGDNFYMELPLTTLRFEGKLGKP